MAAHQGYLYSVPQFDFEDAVKPGGYGAPGIGDYDHDPSERQERADTEGPHYTLNSLSWREPAGTTSRHSPPGKEKDAEGKDVSLVDLENALKEKRMLEDRSQREKDAIQRRIDSITSRLGCASLDALAPPSPTRPPTPSSSVQMPPPKHTQPKTRAQIARFAGGGLSRRQGPRCGGPVVQPEQYGRREPNPPR